MRNKENDSRIFALIGLAGLLMVVVGCILATFTRFTLAAEIIGVWGAFMWLVAVFLSAFIVMMGGENGN